MKMNTDNQLWNEICFILHDSIKPDINEKDFESQVIRAIEKLGWLEYEKGIKRQPVLKLGRNIQVRPDLVMYGPKGNAFGVIEVKRPVEDLTKKESTEQLISYMLQLKAKFGLLIGKNIRIYYDGKHNIQQKPVLLESIDFERDSEGGSKIGRASCRERV